MLLLTGEDDLRDVMSAVKNLAGMWKDLGISLGLRPSDLKSILTANPHSPDDCLREMILQWLKQSYNVCFTLILYLPYLNTYVTVVCPIPLLSFPNVEKLGMPTWKRLVEAVEDDAGGNNPALAQTIARDHPGEPGNLIHQFAKPYGRSSVI